MSTPVIVTTAAINYTMGSTDCQISVAADSVLGPTYTQTMVALVSADLPPDWTDAQLCAAVAAKLGVPAADVSVATAPVPPAPPAPEPTPEPVVEEPAPVVVEPAPVDAPAAPVAPSDEAAPAVDGGTDE